MRTSFIVVLYALCGISLSMPPATPEVADERDRQVLESALLHLLAANDFDMTRAPKKGATVVLHTRTPEKTGMIGPDQIRGELRGDHKITEDVLRDLLRRNGQLGTFNSKAVSYADLKFDFRIEVADLNGGGQRSWFGVLEKEHPKARGWMEAYLPGYSEDGSHAVVRGWVGPWPHGAAGTVFLEKKGGKWVVKWHHVAFFA